jgi:hypothetical protein
MDALGILLIFIAVGRRGLLPGRSSEADPLWCRSDTTDPRTRGTAAEFAPPDSFGKAAWSY